MKKPKILFIMHMPPPVHGAAMMGKYIHDSKLINASFDCYYINPSISDTVASVGKVSLKKIVRLLGKYFEVLKSIIKVRPDLCYFTATCSGWGIIRDAMMVALLKLCRRKVVLHLHNKGMKNLRGNRIAGIFYRIMFSNVKVILLSELLYEDVAQFVKRENVYICPNGIPDETLGCEPSAERHNTIPHLLFLSNLLETKGVIVLLDALKILKDKGYSFVCDFVGGESKEIDASRFNKEVRERGLNKIAIYEGKKYGEEKTEAYQQADVFVFPTYHETFGLVNLEAMEQKLPVVSTDEGGIPDVIKDGENGLIAKCKDAFSLADCIEKLLGDKQLREKMGEDGYKKFKSRFTQQAFDRKLQSIMKEVLRSSMGGGGVNVNLVYYWGKKYGKEKEAFFRNADVFIFPTFYPNECFPLVLLEAMQHGLPCITTNEGAINDIVDDGYTGLTTESRNANDLADKIAWMLENPEDRKRMGQNGYIKYKKKLTLSTFEYNLWDKLVSIIE